MDQDKMEPLLELQEALQKFIEEVSGLENKDLKFKGSALQQKLLSSYWMLQHYLESLDITGFPVKILEEHGVYITSNGKGVSNNLIKQFLSTNLYPGRTRVAIRIPANSLGVLIDVKEGRHLVGIYDRIGDMFITRYKLQLRAQDYTTDLTPEERAKVENARKKLIMRKYKKNNFKIISKLQETKA
jgi:hypothetical protein